MTKQLEDWEAELADDPLLGKKVPEPYDWAEGNKTSTLNRKIKTTERDALALELKKAGISQPEIAERLGYPSNESAAQAISRALNRIIEPVAKEVRQLELQRLDSLWFVAYKRAREGSLPAVDRCLSIMDRRARLLGLDAEKKVDVTSGGNPLGRLTGQERMARIVTILDWASTDPAGSRPDGERALGSGEQATDRRLLIEG